LPLHHLDLQYRLVRVPGRHTLELHGDHMLADRNAVYLVHAVLDLRADELVLADEKEDLTSGQRLTVHGNPALDGRSCVVGAGTRAGGQQRRAGEKGDPGRAPDSGHVTPPYGNWFGLRAEPQAAERPGSVAGPAGYTPNRAMPECRRGQLHPFVRRIDLRCPLIRPLPAPTTPGSHQQTSFHIKNIRLVGPGLDDDRETARL